MIAGKKIRRCALAAVTAAICLVPTSVVLADAAVSAEQQENGESGSAQQPLQVTHENTSENTQSNTPPNKKLKITSEYSFTSNTVQGPGADSSNLSRGSHFTDALTFDWDNRKDDQGLSLNFALNITDDSSVDPKRLSLTNFLLNYASPTNTVTLGDVMGSFSNYSMSGSVKGLAYTYKNEEKNGPEIDVIYGTQYARWDNFWDNDPTTQSKPREAKAIRIKQVMGDDLTLGFNAVRTHDRWGLSSFDTLYDTTVYSTNWEYKPSPFWTYNGEYACSKANAAAGEGSDYVGSYGRAFRFSSVGEKGKKRFALDYERVTPNFLTQMGSAASDRESIKTSWKDRLGLGSIYHTTVYWDRNNLADQLTTTTQNINYDVGVTFQQAFGREDGSFDISMTRNREHDTDSINTLEKALNYNYKDIFNGIDTDATVSYTRTDSATNSGHDYSWTHNLMFSGNKVRGKTTIVPTLTISHAKQVMDFSNSRVMTRAYSLGATVTYGNGDSLNLVWGWKNADYYSLSDNSSNWFATLNWTFKPELLKKLGATSMYLKVGINDYIYTDTSRNYRENSIASGIKCEF